MKQPKQQPARPARSRARRVKAPRYPRRLIFAPPPIKGQSDFDFSIAEEKGVDENNRSCHPATIPGQTWSGRELLDPDQDHS